MIFFGYIESACIGGQEFHFVPRSFQLFLTPFCSNQLPVVFPWRI
jgi:hypothetical protein